MEETDCNDVLDDWFIESLKTYTDLHVYQLEHPTQVLEWTSGRTVCVAGYNPTKNEILELNLPLKLFADENKGLCAERDFKVVHGGFTDGPVRCLRHVPGTRCVVTNDGLSSDLQVWSVGGDDSDVIRLTGRVEGRKREKRRISVSEGSCRIAARLSSQVLHGAQSSDVQLTELTSGQILYSLETDSDDPLSSLHFVSDAVFLAGCSNGNVYVADTRTSAAPQLYPPPASSGESVLWWTDASTCSVVRLSSSGLAVISDLRNPGGAVSRTQLDVQSGRCNPEVSVSWAPALDDCIAVSGFSGSVQIYNTSLWTTAPQQEVHPLFEHRGHAVSSQSGDDVFITAHVWHPDRPRTLLSAASDGSVHVWDWVDQSAQEKDEKS
ncbi:WD repeat-containing protein 73 [Anoplopoma fimbria]|uniref:WD repeat-containing protein 73 n=1 Tax=Anoplopoma fimbria TaxID=229290 RepID=UPI0023ECFD11|nr:WD repeat-containing protein 73 [Anoplopoma fimbria]